MSVSRLRLLAAAVVCLMAASGHHQARQTPPDPPGETPQPAPVEDAPAADDSVQAPAEPTEERPPATDERSATPAGALAYFMAARDYRTIRELKSIMTPGLKAVYDRDSVSFNGKQGTRLAAFDFREPPPNPSARKMTVAVKSLWEDQGEAIELRTETAGLEREESGLWRVARLERRTSEPLRYKGSVSGVTVLRLILRAWQRRDLAGAKSHMSEAFLKRYAGREEGIEAVFSGDPSLKRAAFRILEVTPRSASVAVARVRLVETAPGRPSSLEGTPKSVELVKRGSRWLLNDWR